MMHTKTKDELREALLEDVPMKNGRVDANKHRMQQSRNLKSVIMLLLDTNTSLADHIDDNKKSFKIIQSSGLVVSAVFGVTIIGIVAGWTWGGGLAFFGAVVKGISMIIGKS